MENLKLYKWMKQCPEFDGCSAPLCPLDPYLEKRVYITGDDRCTTKAKTRYLIAKNSVLKYRGLTKQEYQNAVEGKKLGWKRWGWFEG